MAALRKYIIAGLLVWLPFAATIVIVKLLIDLMDKTILLLPPDWQPANLFGFSIPGFGVILAVSILLLTGVLAANLFGRRFVELWEKILNKIPLVRSIYSSVKQISSTIFDPSGKSFRKVVLLQYPRKGVWSIGFLTNDNMGDELNTVDDHLTSVFIPTTPNPTSGFIIMVRGDELKELNMSVEEAFKFIISMGVIIPDSAALKELSRN
tara:strand:+ start:518 stop:1144 length:627 start_codon:yes stop_codon:yes gene_type:complete